MKKIIGSFFITLVLLAGCDSTSVPVKKSKTNICHKKGSKYYQQTKHFSTYNTIKECIESAGMFPKKDNS